MKNALGGSRSIPLARYQPPSVVKGRIVYPMSVPVPKSSLIVATSIRMRL